MFKYPVNATQRILSENNDVDENQIVVLDPAGSPLPYTYSNVSKPLSRDRWQMIGQDLPDYHRRMNSGELMPFTNFERYELKGSTSGVYNWYQTNGNHFYDSNSHGHIEDDSWIVSDEMIRAYAPSASDMSYYLQRASAYIYSQGFDTLTFAAELRDTIKLFTRVRKSITRLDIENIGKVLTGGYLEFRYGLRPLLYDLESFKNAFEILKDKRSRFTERSGDSSSQTSVITDTQSWAGWTVNRTITDTIDVNIRSSVCADFDLPAFQLDPIQTAWEVTKFSFVLDWLLNVGQALAAFSFALRVKEYSSCTGYQVKYHRALTKRKGTPTSIFQSGSYSQDGESTRILSVRTPTPVDYIPHLKLRLNLWKSFDLIALELQLLGMFRRTLLSKRRI